MIFSKGDKVRWNYNNAIGLVTGRSIGSRIQVKFNEGDIRYIEEQNLECVADDECIFEKFDRKVFSGIDDYRRALNRYRLSGELTDIMYSMSNSKTEFFPHQFIPIIKFLESYSGRLLIADEVGLGKTVEAMYIWEELRARYNARRLLIVAPAVLRIKWKSDLDRFFNIDATIVKAQGKDQEESLLSRLKHVVSHPGQDAFAYIISIEGLRAASEVVKILEDNADVLKLFDLVVIDEAHYMRNSETQSFKLGAKLRDVTEYLLLLSATPIQTSSDNFYNLLRLLGPEEFDSQWAFNLQLEDLVPLVQLTNSLEGNAPKEVVKEMLADVLVKQNFDLDADCRYLERHLDEVLNDTTKRVTLIRRLKSKFFYDPYVTRTRKRDVLDGRTERRACAVQFSLSPVEMDFYQQVTEHLCSRDDGGSEFSVFRLIARQRQMASCMPAALSSWRKQALPIRNHWDESDAEECSEEDGDLFADITGSIDCENSGSFVMPGFDGIDLKKLVSVDSKFAAVLSQIRAILNDDPHEKIVVFSFFRGTVAYLYERLREAGIKTVYLMGGLSGEEKTSRLNRFKNTDVSVLVSSEVGSEGIDLQFARHEINYDLPWNPMRLEQRIGRIDRIGQKSQEIFIYNAFCENTIEDRILSRLYGRIERFRTVIGDLEEILGGIIKSLEIETFRNRTLTENDIRNRLSQIDHAFENRRRMSQELEKDAGYITAYQRHILDNIKRARDNMRRLTPDETYHTVKDFLNSNYPGSSVRAADVDGFAYISLSDAARAAFSDFISESQSLRYTQLNYNKNGVLCAFDDKDVADLSPYHEKIDVNHPLVKWMLSELHKNLSLLSGCELLCLDSSDCSADWGLQPGLYFYYIQNWCVDGVRTVNELHYYMANIEDGSMLDHDLSERIMVTALLKGKSYDVGLLDDAEFRKAQQVMLKCTEFAFSEYDEFSSSQKRQNTDLVVQQRQYVEKTVDWKLSKITDTINRLLESDKAEGVVKMWKGKADKIKQDKNLRMSKLDAKLMCQDSVRDVAVGMIYIGR